VTPLGGDIMREIIGLATLGRTVDIEFDELVTATGGVPFLVRNDG